MHISYLAGSYFQNYEPFSRTLRQYPLLQNLRKNNDIVITKPDKENGVVILDRKIYNSATEKTISDTSKFEKLNEDRILKREATTSAPARIYGIPKIHKFSSSDSFPKHRLIVLSEGTFSYNLAHLVWNLPSPLVPNDYSCKDTFSFVSQIENANLSKTYLVSYNVTSLFANSPLQETTDIAINLIFNHNAYLNITRKELKKTFPFWHITDSFYF